MWTIIVANKKRLYIAIACAFIAIAFGFCGSRPAHAQAGGFPSSSGTFTWTLSGCSLTTTGTGFYSKVGTLVHVTLVGNTACTSTTTLHVISGFPANIQASRTWSCIMDNVLDNTVSQTGPGILSITSGTTWSLYKNPQYTAWTATGQMGWNMASCAYSTN